MQQDRLPDKAGSAFASQLFDRVSARPLCFEDVFRLYRL